MKSSHGVLVGIAVCALAAAAAWWWSGAESPHASSPEPETSAAADEDAHTFAAALESPAERGETSFELDADVFEHERAEIESASAPQTAEPAGPSALVRGSLRDENTSEPLPAFLLRLHDRTHNEDVVTDASGRFETKTPFLLGRVRVDPLDRAQRRRSAPSIQVDHELVEGAAVELSLAVPSGPTFTLAFTPADSAPLDTLRVTLVVRDDEEQDRLGGETVRTTPTNGADVLAPLAWVRFGPVPAPFERAERIEVRDPAGLWMGDARVSRVSGVEPAPIDVKLTALAALRGRVVDESGAPVERALVELRPADPAAKIKPRSTNADGDGRYTFDFLAPGTYVASFKTLRHLVQERTVELVARVQETLDASLVPKPSAGPIRGEVVTQSGTSTPKARVTLTLPRGDRSLPPLSTDVVWTTVDGRKVGRFEFANMPEGALQLRVERDDWFTWEPAKLDVAAPREGIRILVYDDVATCDYAVRVRDRDNGLALDRLHVWLEFEGGPQRDRRATSDEIFERGVPVGRKFRWRVDRSGYEFAAGDETTFALEEHREGRLVRVAELDLAPGWSEIVRAVRRDGRGVVGGVEVFADGVSVGKTDASGNLKIELRDPPKRLDAKHADFTLQGRPNLDSAWKRDQRRFVQLTMAPVRRGGGKPAASR